MNHRVSSIAPSDLEVIHELPPSVPDQGIVARPNKNIAGKFLLPFVALATFATACSNSEETMVGSSSESVPTTGLTPTTESTPTTELTPTTEPIPTTVLETTTTIKVDLGGAANCRYLRDNDALPGGFLELIDAPNIDEMEFFISADDCDMVQANDYYYWGWPGEQGHNFVINAEPPKPVQDADGNTYSPYDTKGNNYRELPAGSAVIPQEMWNAKHPELPGVTLLQLAGRPGAKICWHVGLNNSGGFDKTYTFERLELRTHFDKSTMTEPEYTVMVVFRHPNGTTIGKEEAGVMGVTPDPIGENGAWSPLWTDFCD